MRILLVNRYFLPEPAPTGVLLSDLAFALTRAGNDVRVVTSRSRYGGEGFLTCPSEAMNGVHIHRVWSPRHRQSGLLGRSLDYVAFYLGGSWRTWRLSRDADFIVAETDPPLLSIITATIAKLRGIPSGNWLQDIFPEVAEALNTGGRPGRLAFSILRILRNWSLRQACMNVVVGETMAEHLHQLDVPTKKTHVIHNWSDGSVIKPIAQCENSLRNEWGLTNSFVVGYAGNLGRAHDIETIIEAMTLLHRRAINSALDDISRQIMFVFIGGGAQLTKLNEEASRRQLTNFQTHPYQPAHRLPETLGIPDVHLVSLNPQLEGLIVPSKFYGISAAGRPTLFVGASDGEIARLVNQASCGFTIVPGDAQQLMSRILQLAQDPLLLASMGKRARGAFEKLWDKQHALEKWLDLFAHGNSARANNEH